MSVNIQIVGLDKIAGKLRDAEPRAWMEAAMQSAAGIVKTYLAHYPTRRAIGPGDWQSEKQRRYYHAMRREQGLPAKYTRNSDPMSQRLGPSWTTRVEARGLRGIVGNRADYARWVQDEDRQQRMHTLTGWRTVQGAVREKSGDVREKLAAALERILR